MDIKPCPFCGETPSLRSWTEYNRSNPMDDTEYQCHEVYCCGIEMDLETWNHREYPEGYALVPIEPTHSIYNADAQADMRHLKKHGVDFNLRFQRFSERYKAMISAAQESIE